MNAKCGACGETKELHCVLGKDGRFYVDIQGKLLLRVKNIESFYFICERCAKFLNLID